MYEVISKYAKSILACTENTLIEYKSLRRIRQEYSIVHEEYEGGQQIEPITMNFRPKPKKNSDPNSPSKT